MQLTVHMHNFSKDFVHYILLEEAYRNFMSCTFSYMYKYSVCMNILSCGVGALHTGAWAYSDKLWEIVSQLTHCEWVWMYHMCTTILATLLSTLPNWSWENCRWFALQQLHFWLYMAWLHQWLAECIYFQVRYCTAVHTYNMVQLLSMSMCNCEGYGRGSSNKKTATRHL